MYFSYLDYTVFTDANSVDKSGEMNRKRKALQSKLLKLHEQIYPEVQKMKLSCHENKKNITTLITPDEHTGSIHSWLFVRYGKTPEEIAPFKEIDLGFIRHACIQYGLNSTGNFEITLFLGNRGDYDLGRVIQTISGSTPKAKALSKEIADELSKLKGYGLVWYTDDAEFDIDRENPEDFCKWLIAHQHAKYIVMSFFYAPDDDRLSEWKITHELLEKIRLLRALYNTLVQRSKIYR